MKYFNLEFIFSSFESHDNVECSRFRNFFEKVFLWCIRKYYNVCSLHLKDCNKKFQQSLSSCLTVVGGNWYWHNSSIKEVWYMVRECNVLLYCEHLVLKIWYYSPGQIDTLVWMVLQFWIFPPSWLCTVSKGFHFLHLLPMGACYHFNLRKNHYQPSILWQILWQCKKDNKKSLVEAEKIISRLY